MRGTLREKKLKGGRLSLYIDYYPPVWNPIKKEYSRREFLKLHIVKNPQTQFERRQNEINREIAEKIYVKRMKSLMLDEHKLFNKDALNADFILYARNFVIGKSRGGVNVEHYNSVLKYLDRSVRAKYTLLVQWPDPDISKTDRFTLISMCLQFNG